MFSSNIRYSAATKEIDVIVPSQFIPVGKVITKEDITSININEKIASSLVQNSEELLGKSLSVSVTKGQYIWKNTIATGKPMRDGYVKVYIPTDLASSACLIAGEFADIHIVNKSMEASANEAPAIYKGARVLNSLDQTGNEIDPTKRNEVTQMAQNGSKIPVSIGVEVPENIAPVIVQACSKKALYLVKSNILPQE